MQSENLKRCTNTPTTDLRCPLLNERSTWYRIPSVRPFVFARLSRPSGTHASVGRPTTKKTRIARVVVIVVNTNSVVCRNRARARTPYTRPADDQYNIYETDLAASRTGCKKQKRKKEKRVGGGGGGGTSDGKGSPPSDV